MKPDPDEAGDGVEPKRYAPRTGGFCEDSDDRGHDDHRG